MLCSEEPLLEEYTTARAIFGLSMTDGQCINGTVLVLLGLFGLKDSGWTFPLGFLVPSKHGVSTAASFQCPKPAPFACCDSTPSSCAHVLAVFPLMEFDRYPLWGEFDSAVWVDLNFHSQQWNLHIYRDSTELLTSTLCRASCLAFVFPTSQFRTREILTILTTWFTNTFYIIEINQQFWKKSLWINCLYLISDGWWVLITQFSPWFLWFLLTSEPQDMCEIAGNSVRQSSFAPRGDRGGRFACGNLVMKKWIFACIVISIHKYIRQYTNMIWLSLYIIYVGHEVTSLRITRDYDIMWLYESQTSFPRIGKAFRKNLQKPWNQALLQLVGEF